MSLIQKRWILKVQEATAAANATLNEKTGLNLLLTVDCESFPDDEQVMDDFFLHKPYGTGSVIDAFVLLTADSLGKEAVQASIQKVMLRNTAQRFGDIGSKSLSLQDGTLTINCSFSGSSHTLYSPYELSKEIEKLL